jgi:hypothetical protein
MRPAQNRVSKLRRVAQEINKDTDTQHKQDQRNGMVVGKREVGANNDEIDKQKRRGRGARRSRN